jgi:steroid delta-isomerase-like uncharacterized protein
MSRAQALAVVGGYYAAFNAGDHAGMIARLTDDVAHDVNQGAREIGKPAFAAFLGRMERAYREQLADLVVMADEDGRRAAAEFTVHGVYLAADEGLPPARGQGYVLSVGAFLELRGTLISRVTTYYNLADWIAQVSR